MSDVTAQEDDLHVDDNPGDVRLIREAFREDADARTLHVVSDGVEALDVLYRREGYADAPRPALVILDLDVPRKSGETILAELQVDDVAETIPIVILTSARADADVQRAYRIGANGFLTKPVDPEGFIELIRSIRRYWLVTVQLPDDD